MFGITIEKEERLPLALIAGGVLLFTGSIGALIGSMVAEKKGKEKDDEEEVEMQPEAVQPESSEKAAADVKQKSGESAEKIIRNMETAEKIKNMINPDNQKTTQAVPAEQVKEPVAEETKTVTEVVGEVVESEKDSESSPTTETTTPPPAETVVAEKVDSNVIEIPPLAQPNGNILNNHFDPQAQAAIKAQAAMMQQQMQQMQPHVQPQVSPIPNPQNIIG